MAELSAKQYPNYGGLAVLQGLYDRCSIMNLTEDSNSYLPGIPPPRPPPHEAAAQLVLLMLSFLSSRFLGIPH